MRIPACAREKSRPEINEFKTILCVKRADRAVMKIRPVGIVIVYIPKSRHVVYLTDIYIVDVDIFYTADFCRV